MHARPFLGDLPGELGRRTVSRAGNGQAVLRDYWEYPAFLMHDAYTMHPDEFADRRGFSKAPRFFKGAEVFQRHGMVRPEPLPGKNRPGCFGHFCGWIVS
jgi:hypothetical protein